MLSPEITATLESYNTPAIAIAYISGLADAGYKFQATSGINTVVVPTQKWMRRPGRPSRGFNAAARTPSKVQQAIIAVLAANPAGITRTAVAKLIPTYKAERVQSALLAMAKAKPAYAYIKGTKWFSGPAPTSSGTTVTKSTKASGTVSLADATMQAMQGLPPGSTGAAVTNYLKSVMGRMDRSNHVGIALVRHAKAGRLVQTGVKPNLAYSIPLQQTG